MTTLDDLLQDLVAETAVLDDLLVGLREDEWGTSTPAEGWSVRDQVSHLAFFDQAAVLSATDPEKFRVEADRLKALGPGFPDIVAEQHRHLDALELGSWFRSARAELLLTFGGLDGSLRVPWFGPDMSLVSSTTARLMETWAHGQDVFDAFGLERPTTPRLRHVAHLGVRTLEFSFQLNGRSVPTRPVHVRLHAPGGDVWQWGDVAAHDRVEGDALDFCLVVTQRRNLADTGLRVRGSVASEWLSIAQTFAGAPGTGRPPLPTTRRVS